MQHVVQQGECVSSIADQYGFDWKLIWSHPDNAGLRSTRKDPNVLYEGDVVTIPDKKPGDTSKSTDQQHKFVKPGVPVHLVLQLLDDDKPRAGLPYELQIGGLMKSGSTDGSGFIRETIPAREREARLIVGSGTTRDCYTLQIGYLDPIDTDSGVKGRLVDLGYGVDDMREGISACQRKMGLPVTGEIDDATRNRLQEKFGQ
jgi:N-acetylmuramoyl-L-alanine amidase